MEHRGGGAASGFLLTVPSACLQLACFLLNQTAWLVPVRRVLRCPPHPPPPPSPLYPPPPAPESPLSASFLFVWLKTWTLESHWEQGGGGGGGVGGGEEEKARGTEGRLAGRRQRETLNAPELGLIYFINRDYKFNLQTRGQNFSLTRGPWRTWGPGDHSYY